jgi:hypothetical protein
MAPQVQIAVIRPLPIVIPIAAPAWAAELPVLAVGRTVDQYEKSQATIKILNAIKIRRNSQPKKPRLRRSVLIIRPIRAPAFKDPQWLQTL